MWGANEPCFLLLILFLVLNMNKERDIITLRQTITSFTISRVDGQVSVVVIWCITFTFIIVFVSDPHEFSKDIFQNIFRFTGNCGTLLLCNFALSFVSFFFSFKCFPIFEIKHALIRWKRCKRSLWCWSFCVKLVINSTFSSDFPLAILNSEVDIVRSRI